MRDVEGICGKQLTQLMMDSRAGWPRLLKIDCWQSVSADPELGGREEGEGGSQGLSSVSKARVNDASGTCNHGHCELRSVCATTATQV